MSTIAGGIAGVFVAILALGLWYVLSTARKRQVAPDVKEEPTELTDRVKEGLIETRMVLPGAQALLGFQVANTLTNSFDRLPRTVQWAHFRQSNVHRRQHDFSGCPCSLPPDRGTWRGFRGVLPSIGSPPIVGSVLAGTWYFNRSVGCRSKDFPLDCFFQSH
jgi:hypothetical protein